MCLSFSLDFSVSRLGGENRRTKSAETRRNPPTVQYLCNPPISPPFPYLTLTKAFLHDHDQSNC